MRSQLERDEVTVTIATSLALLLAVLIIGGAALGLLGWAADLPEMAAGALFLFVSAAAIWISGSYLWRHRRA
jgi:membrane protein YdbS with pleckstrin-like domain